MKIHIKNVWLAGFLAVATLFLFTHNSMFAQASSVRVMTARNSSFSSDGNEWKSLRCGVQLQDKDKIKVDAGGMAILVHSSGKTIEVKSAGSYSVGDLSAKAQSGKGVAGKFAGYVMDELTKGDKKDARFQQNMMFTGATSKMSNSTKKLCLDSPNFTNFLGRKVTLAWRFCDNTPKFEAADKSQATDGNNTVIVTITDSLDTPIREETVDGTIFSFDANMLEKGKLYKWSVHLKSKPRVQISDNTFRIVHDSEAKQIEAEAKTIVKELGEDSAWSDIVTASLYEQNKLYDLALTRYRAGINRDPSVPEYKQLYAKCLERVGLEK